MRYSMKLIVCFLTVCLLLSGCLSDPLAETTNTAGTVQTTVPEETTIPTTMIPSLPLFAGAAMAICFTVTG